MSGDTKDSNNKKRKFVYSSSPITNIDLNDDCGMDLYPTFKRRKAHKPNSTSTTTTIATSNIHQAHPLSQPLSNNCEVPQQPTSIDKLRDMRGHLMFFP